MREQIKEAINLSEPESDLNYSFSVLDILYERLYYSRYNTYDENDSLSGNACFKNKINFPSASINSSNTKKFSSTSMLYSAITFSSCEDYEKSIKLFKRSFEISDFLDFFKIQYTHTLMLGGDFSGGKEFLISELENNVTLSPYIRQSLLMNLAYINIKEGNEENGLRLIEKAKALNLSDYTILRFINEVVTRSAEFFALTIPDSPEHRLISDFTRTMSSFGIDYNN